MKPSNVSSNYSVFLETLNRAQRAPGIPPDVAGGRAAESGLRPLDVVEVLARHTGPVPVFDLAQESKANITPIVLVLQKLKDNGMVNVHAETDEVELTDLGRQMLKVGQLLESKVDTGR